MEDLEGANTPPIIDDSDLPEANNDPQDPLAPEIEEENSTKNPPFAEPTLDMEATEDQAPDVPDPDSVALDDNDADSDALSDVDEAQFEDFDANAIAIEERPRVVDASGVALLGKHKRKREEGEEGVKKKRKEGRREKPKRSKKRAEEGEDEFNDADDLDGGRSSRKKKRGAAEGGEAPRRRKRTPSAERDELLTPEERKLHRISIPLSCRHTLNTISPLQVAVKNFPA